MGAKHGRIEGLITVPTNGWDFDLQVVPDDGIAVTVTIAAGTYYPTDLVAEVINEGSTQSAGSIAGGIGSGEDGTGKTTLSTGSTELRITWTDTELRDCLGYTGNLTGAAAHVATKHTRCVWIPDAPFVNPYGVDDAGWDEGDARGTESPEGAIHLIAGHYKEATSLTWNGVSRAKTRIAGESTTDESFQRFWRDCIMGENPGGVPSATWAVMYDADGAWGTRVEYSPSGDILRTFRPEPLQQGWVEHWRILLDRLVKVPS